jgi:hypothetical protein
MVVFHLATKDRIVFLTFCCIGFRKLKIQNILDCVEKNFMGHICTTVVKLLVAET